MGSIIGGTILQPQEIRVALYHGVFASLLSKLNDNSNWRSLYGRKSQRLKDIELILRFLGLYFHSRSYKRPMKAFLNRYMATNQDLSKQAENVIIPIFENTVSAILNGIGKNAFRPFSAAVNAAVLESVMYGVAARLATGPLIETATLKTAYDALLQLSSYKDAVSSGTADEVSVSMRLSDAKAAFADLP